MYIPTHTFYYADDIGSEFKTTTDMGFAAHTANAVYYGKELQPRLDDDKYADDNGDTVSSTATMSASADDSAQFVISASNNIPSPSRELTASLITPYGQTSEDADFTYESVNGNSKRILVKMVLKNEVIPGAYTVHLECGNMACDLPITLTGAYDTPLMDFTDQFDKYIGGTLTLADITSDGTLNVEFAPLETFKLDVECDDFDNLYYDVNGTFNQSDGYTEGTELTVSFVPEPDWEITSVKLNGKELTLTTDNKYTFTITENSTLFVEMENLIKTVTVNKTGEGTAESSIETVTKGGDIEFTVIPANGWRLKSAELNGVDVTAQIDTNGVLMVRNVTEDITLEVVFVELSKCALDVTIPHGSFTADPAGLSYEADTQVTVTLTPEPDWEITAVTLNGRELALTEDNKYTFTITEDSKLVVEMENLIKTV